MSLIILALLMCFFITISFYLTQTFPGKSKTGFRTAVVLTACICFLIGAYGHHRVSSAGIIVPQHETPTDGTAVVLEGEALTINLDPASLSTWKQSDFEGFRLVNTLADLKCTKIGWVSGGKQFFSLTCYMESCRQRDQL